MDRRKTDQSSCFLQLILQKGRIFPFSIGHLMNHKMGIEKVQAFSFTAIFKVNIAQPRQTSQVEQPYLLVHNRNEHVWLSLLRC